MERPELAHVLAPIEPGVFLDRIFERELLHVRRSDPTYFAELYGVDELEQAMHVGATEFSRFNVTRNGSTAAPMELQIERPSVRSRYTQRAPIQVLDPRAVAARFQQGYTLLVNDASRFSSRLQGLCNRLQAELFAFVQVNAYLTPPNERGFSLHHDTHDTLVLQIEGAKRWRVYDQLVPLPIESQPHITSKDEDKTATLQDEIELQAGDTLYLPRGYRHVCTTAGVRSLHLTLALLPVRAIELAEAALQLAATVDVDLRRALPFGWQERADFPEEFAALLGEHIRKAFTTGLLRGARELVINELFSTSRIVSDGSLQQAERLGALAPQSRIALRHDNPFLLRERGNELELVVAGKSTRLPAASGPAIRALESGPRTIAELDALIPGSGAALARLLVLDGIATIQ